MAFFSCVLSGCTTRPTQLVESRAPEPNKEFAIIRDYETTWNALMRALDGRRDRTVKSQSKRRGRVVLESISVPMEEFCDCGSLGETPLTGGTVRKTTIRIKKRAPKETLLEIACTYTTTYTWKDVYGRPVKKETVPCVSNGRFEAALHAWVMRYMAP